MHDALLVRRLDRAGDLPPDAKRFGDRQRAASQPISERWPLHELEDQRGSGRGLLETVDGRDVGVVQAGHDARLALQTRQAIAITSELLGQYLERDVAT